MENTNTFLDNRYPYIYNAAGMLWKMMKTLGYNWKRILFLLTASVLLSVLMQHRWGIAFADFFFIAGMLSLMVALMGIVRNLGFFGGVSHGARLLFRIMRNKHKPSREDDDEEAEYVTDRRRFTGAPILIAFGLALILMSVLLSSVQNVG